MTALPEDTNKIRIAALEGFHPFDVVAYYELLRSLEFADCFAQNIENWAVDHAGCRYDYDVFLFYSMNMDINKLPFGVEVDAALRGLGDRPQGIVIWHHALLAFPKHPVWSEIIGLPDRTFEYFGDQDYTIDIANPNHPITQGLAPGTLHDETYTLPAAADGCEVLFKTDFPNSTRTPGWTRTYRNARVFCFQPGHNAVTWQNPWFREVFRRGILWAAGKI